jgi:hypothetical protein
MALPCVHSPHSRACSSLRPLIISHPSLLRARLKALYKKSLRHRVAQWPSMTPSLHADAQTLSDARSIRHLDPRGCSGTQLKFNSASVSGQKNSLSSGSCRISRGFLPEVFCLAPLVPEGFVSMRDGIRCSRQMTCAAPVSVVTGHWPINTLVTGCARCSYRKEYAIRAYV